MDTGEFEKIDQVIGKGMASKYFFFDEYPPLGPNIYRLKQIDYNGNFTYSGQLEIFWLESDDFAVYPNPGNAVLNLQTLTDGPFELKLMEITGRVIIRKSGRLIKGQAIEIDTYHLQEGSYLFELSYGNKISRGKWIKRP